MPHTHPSSHPLHAVLRVCLLAGLIGLGGCESIQEYRIAPSAGNVPLSGQTTSSVVEKKHRVTVEPKTPVFSSLTRQIPTFHVAFENRGSSEVPFKPSDVTVFSGDQPVRAYLPVELVELIQEAATRDADEYTGQQAEVFLGSTGGDPSATIAKIEGAKRTNAAASRQASQQDQLAEVVQLIIPMNVPPGESSSGLLKLHAKDIQPGQPLRIIVTIAGEAYEFSFEVNEA